MPEEYSLLFCLAIMTIGFLYSSVGHAGATGYIAVMFLFGFDPGFIKPTALLLNIFVAAITSWQFYQAGHFRGRLFWPFVLLSAPLAFLGGYLNLPGPYFKILVGFVLLFSAYRFFARPQESAHVSPPGIPAAIILGGLIGFLSGLTGIGGGVFLTPLLLFLKWARIKSAAAVSALFILVNSLSGLMGNLYGTGDLPSFGLLVAVCAIAGGAIGSYLGSRHLEPAIIKRLLAMVLFVAGLRLIFAS